MSSGEGNNLDGVGALGLSLGLFFLAGSCTFNNCIIHRNPEHFVDDLWTT